MLARDTGAAARRASKRSFGTKQANALTLISVSILMDTEVLVGFDARKGMVDYVVSVRKTTY